MRRIEHPSLGPFNVGAGSVFSEENIRKLIELMSRPPQKGTTVLGGRSTVILENLPAVGEVAIKYFTRGGVFGKLVSQHYFRIGKPRCQGEFELMELVRERGVNAPEPLAYVTQGGMFYKAWLVSRAVSEAQNAR